MLLRCLPLSAATGLIFHGGAGRDARRYLCRLHSCLASVRACLPIYYPFGVYPQCRFLSSPTLVRCLCNFTLFHNSSGLTLTYLFGIDLGLFYPPLLVSLSSHAFLVWLCFPWFRYWISFWLWCSFRCFSVLTQAPFGYSFSLLHQSVA